MLVILVERATTIAAWEVNKADSCFIITLISVISLFYPVNTALAEKSVASARTVWPSTLASISMMRSACTLDFSSRDVGYSIDEVWLSSAVVAVNPPWGASRVWGRGAYRNTALLSN